MWQQLASALQSQSPHISPCILDFSHAWGTHGHSSRPLEASAIHICSARCRAQIIIGTAYRRRIVYKMYYPQWGVCMRRTVTPVQWREKPGRRRSRAIESTEAPYREQARLLGMKALMRLTDMCANKVASLNSCCHLGRCGCMHGLEYACCPGCIHVHNINLALQIILLRLQFHNLLFQLHACAHTSAATAMFGLLCIITGAKRCGRRVDSCGVQPNACLKHVRSIASVHTIVATRPLVCKRELAFKYIL